MDDLREMLNGVESGAIPDPAPLERLLAVCWHEFDGSSQESMDGSKLLGRMEEVRWEPPFLTFVVERHGGTVCGSTRAERLHWQVDLEGQTATITKVGYRQLKPMAARISIKAIARELVQKILEGTEDARVGWPDDQTVYVRAALVFPTGSGFQRTVAGRRKSLCRYIAETLAVHGWVDMGGNFFKRMGTAAPTEGDASAVT